MGQMKKSRKGGDDLQSKFEQQMKKGVLDMLVLKLLEKEEKYGYQLISQLRDKSDGMIALKEGTLYPILYRLEDDELIRSHWSEPKGREVSRKYYGITDRGRQRLNDMFALWSEFYGVIRTIMEEGAL